MHVSDLGGRSLDPTAKSITVVFKPGDTTAREIVPALARTTSASTRSQPAATTPW